MTIICTHADWLAKVAAVTRDGRPVLDGKRIDAEVDRQFESINPTDGTIIAQLPACDGQVIDAAVASARRASTSRGGWAKWPARARAVVLSRLAQLVERDAADLALLDALEMGMPISQGLADIALIASQIRFCSEAADKLVDEALAGATGGFVLAIREPQGVVAAITPWNFPLYTAALKIAPALIAGNCVVLKPSEVASLSALRLGDLALEAGLPPGVLNVIPGLGRVAGAALAAHMDVDYLTFTGSTATGGRIMALAGGSNLKQLALECGGKSPQIVLQDAVEDDALAAEICASVFWNAGQVCTSGSRLIVPESRVDEIVARVVRAAEAFAPGDPLNPVTAVGPLSNFEHRDRVQRFVECGKQGGATLHCGGRPQGLDSGAYLLPSVFSRVRGDMVIAREEIFGPVLSILTYRTLDEAIELANATAYGLAATVRTADVGAGFDIARRLQSGIVNVVGPGGEVAPEAMALAAEPRKQSGFGVEGGLAGIRAYTRLKSVTFAGGRR